MKYFTYNQNPEPASPSVLPNRALGSWLQGSLQLQQTEADLDKMGERRKCPFAFSVKLLSLPSSQQAWSSISPHSDTKEEKDRDKIANPWGLDDKEPGKTQVRLEKYLRTDDIQLLEIRPNTVQGCQ